MPSASASSILEASKNKVMSYATACSKSIEREVFPDVEEWMRILLDGPWSDASSASTTYVVSRRKYDPHKLTAVKSRNGLQQGGEFTIMRKPNGSKLFWGVRESHCVDPASSSPSRICWMRCGNAGNPSFVWNRVGPAPSAKEDAQVAQEIQDKLATQRGPISNPSVCLTPAAPPSPNELEENEQGVAIDVAWPLPKAVQKPAPPDTIKPRFSYSSIVRGHSDNAWGKPNAGLVDDVETASAASESTKAVEGAEDSVVLDDGEESDMVVEDCKSELQETSKPEFGQGELWPSLVKKKDSQTFDEDLGRLEEDRKSELQEAHEPKFAHGETMKADAHTFDEESGMVFEDRKSGLEETRMETDNRKVPGREREQAKAQTFDEGTEKVSEFSLNFNPGCFFGIQDQKVEAQYLQLTPFWAEDEERKEQRQTDHGEDEPPSSPRKSSEDAAVRQPIGSNLARMAAGTSDRSSAHEQDRGKESSSEEDDAHCELVEAILGSDLLEDSECEEALESNTLGDEARDAAGKNLCPWNSQSLNLVGAVSADAALFDAFRPKTGVDPWQTKRNAGMHPETDELSDGLVDLDDDEGRRRGKVLLQLLRDKEDHSDEERTREAGDCPEPNADDSKGYETGDDEYYPYEIEREQDGYETGDECVIDCQPLYQSHNKLDGDRDGYETGGECAIECQDPYQSQSHCQEQEVWQDGRYHPHADASCATWNSQAWETGYRQERCYTTSQSPAFQMMPGMHMYSQGAVQLVPVQMVNIVMVPYANRCAM